MCKSYWIKGLLFIRDSRAQDYNCIQDAFAHNLNVGTVTLLAHGGAVMY